MAPPDAQQDRGHAAVDQRGQERRRHAEAEFLRLIGLHQTHDRRDAHHKGGDENQPAFQAAGEEFDLFMAIGVRAINRTSGITQRNVGDHRRRQIHHRLGRLGQQTDRTGQAAQPPI